jgi:hypothetical protein
MSSKSIVFKQNREFDLFLAKLTGKAIASCFVIVVVSLLQLIHIGYADKYIFIMVGAIVSPVAMLMYLMQVVKHSGMGKRGFIPMLIAVSGFIPYLFGCYLVFYEGIWNLKSIFNGFSFTVILRSAYYVFFGYAVLMGIYKVSELGKAIDDENIIIEKVS